MLVSTAVSLVQLFIIIHLSNKAKKSFRDGMAVGIIEGKKHGIFLAHLRAAHACQQLVKWQASKRMSPDQREVIIVIETRTTMEPL